MILCPNLFIKDSNGKTHHITSESNLDIVYGQAVHRYEFGISKGTFWSNGRGSIKFSYAPDSALLIVINNGLISVRERDDGPISKYSIKDSPISDLFSENFNFEKLEKAWSEFEKSRT